MLKRLRLAARGLFQKDLVEREFSEELRFHIERETELNISRGMAPEEARRRAVIALGGIEPTREQQREGRESRGIEDLVADTKYAARALWHDKPLAMAGLVTLALGIGATTAVFSAVNAVMLRDLPFGASHQLISLWEENKPRGWYQNVVAPANYIDWAAQTKSFSGMAAFTDFPSAATLLGQGDPRLLSAISVSGNFVDVLQIKPALGRGFDAAETWDTGQRRMMISHRLWKSEFGGDSAVLGRKIKLGGATAWEIIGVMPEGFSYPVQNLDIYTPLLFARASVGTVSFRRAHWLRVIGRLKEGVTADRANADFQAVVKKLQQDYPATNAQMGGGVTPIREWIVGDTRKPLLLLLGASIVLLLIACANVGNLLLVHAVSRTREMSLRFVLGASRLRVARLALTQSLLLSLLGGLGGLLIGWAGARALISLQPSGMLPVTEIPLDWRVAAFTIALTTASGLAFGLAPALMATRQSPADALNAGGRSVAGGGFRRWARQLVVSEVALAALLLVGASLLVRSYRNVAAVAPGFDSEGVLTASFTIPASRYDSAYKIAGFYRTLFERLEAQPGVVAVGAARELPATVSSWTAMFSVQGRPPYPEQGNEVIYRPMAGNYFSVMHVPVLKGRTFTFADGANSPRVAIINEAVAKKYFADEDPIGKLISQDRVPDSTSSWATVVGVVGSERQSSLVEPPRPEVFFPVEQNSARNLKVVIRTEPGRDPVSLTGGVRRTIRDIDSLLAIASIRPMTEVHGDAMSRQRFMSVLVFVFAATGVLLAIVGVFGVLAQLVQSRTREMGLRIALGALPQQVTWMVIRNGLKLVATGVVLGLAIALGATSVMTSLLYGVKPTDAMSYLAASFSLVALGTIAAAIPAIRASAANPAITLRSE